MALTLACTLSDRTQPILDGRVGVAGIRLDPLVGEAEDIFRRAFRDRDIELTELPMATHIATTARGEAPYVGVPVFLARAFQHGALFVRTDRGIRDAAGLAGRRIGVPDYHQTASLWVRGILRDQHGVDSGGIAWRTGGLDTPGAAERPTVRLPPGADVVPIGPDETLDGLLASGVLDAVVAPRPPPCVLARSAPVARLYPDYRTEEEAYYQATGFFPILHCLAVRQDAATAHPWLPRALLQAFTRAKALSLAGTARASLPWIGAEIDGQSRTLGGDPWPYGFACNRQEIAAMIRYAAEDGLVPHALSPEALFHPSTLDAA